jgi:hypothetical protein
LYDSFSTGSDSFSLGQISLVLSAAAPNDAGTFTVTVLSGLTFPDLTVYSAGTVNDSALSTSPSTFNLNFASISLAAGTRYWIELAATGSVAWSYDGDASGTGVVGEFFQNQNGVFDSSLGPYQMQISDDQVAAVPELSSWSMMILGFVGLIFFAHFGRRFYGNIGLDLALPLAS